MKKIIALFFFYQDLVLFHITLVCKLLAASFREYTTERHTASKLLDIFKSIHTKNIIHINKIYQIIHKTTLELIVRPFFLRRGGWKHLGTWSGMETNEK